MAKYLQLYLDTDFITAIGVGESEYINKFTDNQASRRLWLYFSRSSNNGTFDSSESNKANFEAGKEGFFGDFWNHVGAGDNVPSEKYPYIELLYLSPIITQLREWCSVTLATESPEIVLNFSTVIPIKARKVFADYLEKKIGKVRSYSIELNDLLALKIVNDYKSLNPAFGDQLLIIQSTGNDILLSVLTWCKNQFLQGDEPYKLKKKGNEFLKKALSQIVVDHYEKTTCHSLLHSQLESEYAYQMQFADKWLQKRNGDENIWIDDFHYSQNPNKIYPPISIDGKQLNLKEKEAIRGTIAEVSKYYQDNIRNNHLHTLLVGDIFKEDIFLKDCVSVTSSDEKYTYFNDNAIQEALGCFRVYYSTFKEDLSQLEYKYSDKTNSRLRVGTYVNNAEILGSLRDNLKTTLDRIKEVINNVEERNNNLIVSWKSCMKSSNFNDAYSLLNQMSSSDDLIICKNESLSVLKHIESKNSLLIELKELVEVSSLVDHIRNRERELRTYVAKVDELVRLPEELKNEVQKYKDKYPQYLELKHKFEVATILLERRNIVEEMKDLTMEPMPVLDIENIKGKIAIKVHFSGGFWGLGSKKSIQITLSIEKPLPCRGVLIVCPNVITKIPDGRLGLYAVDIEKDSVGNIVDLHLDYQTLGLDKNTKSLFVKFWPHENDSIPINKFDIQGGGLITL